MIGLSFKHFKPEWAREQYRNNSHYQPTTKYPPISYRGPNNLMIRGPKKQEEGFLFEKKKNRILT